MLFPLDYMTQMVISMKGQDRYSRILTLLNIHGHEKQSYYKCYILSLTKLDILTNVSEETIRIHLYMHIIELDCHDLKGLSTLDYQPCLEGSSDDNMITGFLSCM